VIVASNLLPHFFERRHGDRVAPRPKAPDIPSRYR
jgi:hypothetical protein